MVKKLYFEPILTIFFKQYNEMKKDLYLKPLWLVSPVKFYNLIEGSRDSIETDAPWAAKIHSPKDAFIRSLKFLYTSLKKGCHYRGLMSPERELVGVILIFRVNKKEKAAEAGGFIDAKFRNRGYAKKSVLLMEDLLRQKGFKKLKAFVRNDNIPSIQSIVKNGFVFQEGVTEIRKMGSEEYEYFLYIKEL